MLLKTRYMTKVLLLLLGLSVGSVALYSVIPTDQPSNIVGEWILEDYKYQPLTEEAKHFRLDLEEKKKAKAVYTFKEGGTAGFGNAGAEDFFYIKDSTNTVYVWSGVYFPYTKTVTEEIKKHERTQIMNAKIDHDKMQLVLTSKQYVVTLALSRL